MKGLKKMTRAQKQKADLSKWVKEMDAETRRKQARYDKTFDGETANIRRRIQELATEFDAFLERARNWKP